MNRKQDWKDQLWNVSLFPICNDPQDGSGQPEPAPRGGSSVTRPALLAVTEQPVTSFVEAA